MRQGHGPQANLSEILVAAAARVARAQSGGTWDEQKPDEDREQAEPCTAGETEKSSRQERK